MEINLNWDLFIIVFFLIIVAYSFLIGKNQTLKVILSTYIAILTADGIGNLIQRYLIGDDGGGVIVAFNDSSAFVVMKISIFVIITLLLATRGAFDIEIGKSKSNFFAFAISLGFGILSAGLIISTILMYISGYSLITAIEAPLNPMADVASISSFVRLMTENYSLWFSLPAIAFIMASMTGEKS
jgi:hypothetical protein